MGNYGTDLEGFGAFEGGVNSDKGAPLVSTNSAGETALLFGAAALREIQAGVANGDFAIPPDAAGDTITEENPLPYWTFTDVNSSGAITAGIVADAGAGSGNVLRFTVASGTLTGKSATLTRYIPVASSASRSFSFYAEATFDGGTNSTQATAKLTCEFYKSDGVTATGTAFDSGAETFSQLQGATGITAPDLYAVAPDLTACTAPADAAYLKITITIATVATQSATRVVDLTEVRVANGLPELILTDKVDPATYPPAFLSAVQGELNIQSGTGDYLLLAPSTIITAATDISLNATNVDANGNLSATGDITVGGDLNLDTRHIIAPLNTGTVQFTRNDTGNRSSITVGRVFPGTQTTRYMDDNGTRTNFSGGIETAGSIVTAGSILNDSISTTTATANAAIWVLSTGTAYTLRRNSSSARYKTNIVDADEAVLEAARKIKPRHYQSTIEDEAGATRLGFIAEEVEAAGLTHAVGYDGQGRVETLDPTALIAALFVRVNDLEERLKALESR